LARQLVAAYSAFARGGEWLAYRGRRQPGSAQRRTSRRNGLDLDVLSDPEAREHISGRGGNLEFPPVR
jgi:hypothetical protein